MADTSYDADWGRRMRDIYGVSDSDLQDEEVRRYLVRKQAARGNSQATYDPNEKKAAAPAETKPAAPAAAPVATTTAEVAKPAATIDAQIAGLKPNEVRSYWDKDLERLSSGQSDLVSKPLVDYYKAKKLKQKQAAWGGSTGYAS